VDVTNAETIGYPALKRDQPDCGVNNVNCKKPDPANEYHRGCEKVEGCKPGPNGEQIV
jgi:hypothetical protein